MSKANCSRALFGLAVWFGREGGGNLRRSLDPAGPAGAVQFGSWGHLLPTESQLDAPDWRLSWSASGGQAAVATRRPKFCFSSLHRRLLGLRSAVYDRRRHPDGDARERGSRMAAPLLRAAVLLVACTAVLGECLEHSAWRGGLASHGRPGVARGPASQLAGYPSLGANTRSGPGSSGIPATRHRAVGGAPPAPCRTGPPCRSLDCSPLLRRPRCCRHRPCLVQVR